MDSWRVLAESGVGLHFVSDHEIGKVTGHWKDQIEDPHYDMSILQSDEEGSASTDDLVGEDADRLLRRAIAFNDEDYRFHYDLARTRALLGNPEAARKSLSRARELAPGNAPLAAARPTDLAPLPD